MNRFFNILRCIADHKHAGCIGQRLIHAARFADGFSEIKAVVADAQGSLFARFAHHIHFAVGIGGHIHDVAVAEQMVLRQIAEFQNILHGNGAVHAVVGPFDIVAVGVFGQAAGQIKGVEQGNGHVGERQLACLADCA